MTDQSQADDAVFQSLVVANINRMSRVSCASALELPPSCAPLLFAAAANLSRVVEICHEADFKSDCQQLRLPMDGSS